MLSVAFSNFSDKTSIPSCNALFQWVLLRMMDSLGFSVSDIDGMQNGSNFASQCALLSGTPLK